MAFPATVDITRQMGTLSSYPGLDTSAWYQDIFAKVMQLSGWFNLSVGNAPPADTRKIWYKVANPPSGAPGAPYVYDREADDWVPLTPDSFLTFLSVTPRPVDFVQAYMPTTEQAPVAGDWWFDTSTGRLSRYITVAANTTIWVDISGATLDGSTIAALSSKTAKTVATLPSVGSVPTGYAGYYVTDANATTLGSIVAGSGSNKVPVFSDGTNWRIG